MATKVWLVIVVQQEDVLPGPLELSVELSVELSELYRKVGKPGKQNLSTVYGMH